jgi:hypothetical protein
VVQQRKQPEAREQHDHALGRFEERHRFHNST